MQSTLANLIHLSNCKWTLAGGISTRRDVLGAIFILLNEIGWVGGPENGDFPSHYVVKTSLRRWVGGTKSLKTPLRNIKMAPYNVSVQYDRLHVVFVVGDNLLAICIRPNGTSREAEERPQLVQIFSETTS